MQDFGITGLRKRKHEQNARFLGAEVIGKYASDSL
jgi:hypothetical protein